MTWQWFQTVQSIQLTSNQFHACVLGVMGCLGVVDGLPIGVVARMQSSLWRNWQSELIYSTTEDVAIMQVDNI